MNPLPMMEAIVYNPLGMSNWAICEWYWAGVQLRNTRRDNLNLATFN